jgi:hypothetical protein
VKLLAAGTELIARRRLLIEAFVEAVEEALLVVELPDQDT